MEKRTTYLSLQGAPIFKAPSNKEIIKLQWERAPHQRSEQGFGENTRQRHHDVCLGNWGQYSKGIDIKLGFRCQVAIDQVKKRVRIS